MYERFFGLSKTPFSPWSRTRIASISPLSTPTQSVVWPTEFSIAKGYLLLTGEAGLGKTTALCALRELLAESKVRSSVIFNPLLTSNEFLEMVLLNFGLEQISFQQGSASEDAGVFSPGF